MDSYSLKVRPINDAHVEEYIAAMKNGDVFPPITVDFDKDAVTEWGTGVHLLVDGFHQAMACLTIDREIDFNTEVECMAVILEMSKEEALWLALGANAKNGQRLSNIDLEGVIGKALENFPNVSLRVLAKHIECGHATVNRYKQKFKNECNMKITNPDEEQNSDSVVSRDTTESDDDLTEEEKQFLIDHPGAQFGCIDDDEDEPPARVISTDGKSYKATKEPRRPKLDPFTPQQQMAAEFGYANAQLPYTYTEQSAAQKIVDALFLLPVSLTMRIYEGRLIIT